MTDRQGFFVGRAVAGGSSSGSGMLPLVTVTTTTTCASNTPYAANSASQIVFTLPASPTVGDRVQVFGLGTGGWQLNANTGQSIYDAGTLGTNAMVGIVGTQYQDIEVVYSDSNTWIVDAGRGTLTAASPNLDPFWGNVTGQWPLDNALTDQSGNALTLTNSNVTFSNASPKFTGTYYGVFNGSSAKLTYGTTSATKFYGDFTAEAWVYLTSYGSGTATILHTGTAYNNGLWMYVDSSTHQFTAVLDGASGTNSTALSLNQWYHVSAVRAGASIYAVVNGSLGATVGSNAAASAAGQLYIGVRSSNNDQWFTGNICGVRITNGIARYTANFTVPTVPWWTSGDTGFDPSFNNVVLHCPLNNSLVDMSGNALTITNNNAVTFSNSGPAIAGTYYASFNGSNQYLSTALSTTITISADFCFEFWCYPTTTGPVGGGLIVGAPATNNLQVLQTASAYTITLTDYGVGTMGATSGAMAQNAWNFVEVVGIGSMISGGKITVFINGASAGTFNAPGSALTIGTQYIGGGMASSYFTGRIQGVRLTVGESRYAALNTNPTAPFPTALPLSYDPLWKEVTCLLPLISGVNDLSGNALSLTPTNITYVSSPSLFGNNMANFDGTSSFAYITSNKAFMFSGDFCVEGFVRVSGSLAAGPVIFDTRASTASAYGFVVYVNPTGYPVISTNNAILITSSIALVSGVTTHISVERIGGMILLFVGGAYAGSGADAFSKSDGNFYLGRVATTSALFWPGQLGMFLVTNGRARHASNFTPPSAPFLTTGTP